MTDPEREDIVSPENTLLIDIHLIRLLSLICWNDSAFESGLACALVDHKTFWSTHYPLLPSGFLAFPLLGLAAIAYDRQMKFDVDSDYLPMRLVTGEAFKD